MRQVLIVAALAASAYEQLRHEFQRMSNNNTQATSVESHKLQKQEKVSKKQDQARKTDKNTQKTKQLKCLQIKKMTKMVPTLVSLRSYSYAGTVTYTADFNVKELENIGRRVEEGEREGEELLEDMMEEWGPKLEQWEREQRAREEKALQELCDAILDGVSIDGKLLRDITGQGNVDKKVMTKDLRDTKNVRSFIRKIAADDVSLTDPENVKITWEGPNEDELQEWLEGIQGEMEDIGEKLEKILGEYERKYDDLGRELEDALEPVGEGLEDLVNRVGDEAKKMADSANTEFYALAMNKSQAQAAADTSSSSGFYYGIASGAMTVFAMTAIYAACQQQSKRKIQSYEQSLL